MQCMKKLSVVVAVISLSYAQAAQAGPITVYTALEEDEIAAYLKAVSYTHLTLPTIYSV